MASAPHFFRIITPNILRDSKLMIPSKFVRDYGKCLSNPLCLKLPNGVEWKVEFTTVDGVAWLHNGWPKFANYHSLKLGSLLVFRFVSNSTFHTMIFDGTGLEIEYYPVHYSHGHESNHDGEFEDDESVVILDSFPQHPRKREKEPLPCHQPCKKMKSAVSNMPKWKSEGKKDPSFEAKTKVRSKVGIKSEVPNVVVNAKVGLPNSNNYASRRRGRAAGISTSKICQKLRDLHWTQLSSSASERTSEFNSMKPSFVVSMLPSYVNRCNLNLPSGFAKEYLACSILTRRDVILETSDGRKWCAKLNSTGGILQPRFQLCCGWRSFMRDNGLQEGDVCVFELSKLRSKFIFNVIIFRQFEDHQHDGNHPQDLRATQRAPSSRSLNASEDGNEFLPRNPFFQVDVRPRKCKHTALDIPSSFARNHLSPNMKTAKLEVKNREWKVGLMQYGGQFRISAGWTAFYNDNSLKDGAKCVFEMASKKNCAFKVTIIRN